MKRTLGQLVILRLFQQGVGWIICRLLELRARLRGNEFYCRALAGNSEYNISINADQTVSCNCQDRDGAGRLGDLKKESFHKIWYGAKASKFRSLLAGGRLPIHWCAKCGDRREVKRGTRSEVVLPHVGLMVENAAACNFSCTSCDRQIVREVQGGAMLQPGKMGAVVETVKTLQPEHLMWFKNGEPFLPRNVEQQVEEVLSVSPHSKIRCSTNGVLLNTDSKRRAAMMMDIVIFSLDGITTPMVRKYQRGGDFDAAYRNLADLVKFRDARGAHKPTIVWKYVLFNWNDRREYVDAAISMAKAIRVDELWILPTMSPPWGISWRYFTNGYAKLGKVVPGEAVKIQTADRLVACT
jgi:MoaA/NifB/PqqE/SkfB family radical SAM enzyme